MTDQVALTAAQRSALDATPWSGYIFVSGRSDKYWRIRRLGVFVETRWGRRGSSGQNLIHHFPTEQAAVAYRNEKEDEKLSHGYVPEGTPAAGAAIAASVGGLTHAKRETVQGSPLPPGAPNPFRPAVRTSARDAAAAASAVALGRFSGLQHEDEED